MQILGLLASRAACCVIFTAIVALFPYSARAQAQEQRRVYIIESYEKGHVCGEPQAEGIIEALAAGGWKDGENLSIKRYWMDTYRVNATPEAMEQQGKIALAEIEAFKPNIVFALDDAAVGGVMMPLNGRPDISVVFSGMNGQPEMYNEKKHYMHSWAHPSTNVTGVCE